MPRTHTVVEGDSLWSLAVRFYGDGTLYPLIAQANSISDPDLIVDGRVLTIPDVDKMPRVGPVFTGSPVDVFRGTLPYASEIFGVYQPLAGWFGQRNTLRAANAIPMEGIAGLTPESFSGSGARILSTALLKSVADKFIVKESQGVLSPVGLATLFREYFFEFDTFLGSPAGHIWISPGGTVEIIEVSTRRTVLEKTAEQSETTTRKAEETLTTQEDIADAIKEDNANDTKLGVSASGGANFSGIYHAEASTSFSIGNTSHKSSEETHKHTRTQSSKVSSEIQRNFKTTFRTVTETTDTTSRRYVLQNTTSKLVNYELRRKMRKVGVQVQHIGTKLSWQVFLDTPGTELGLGELIHVVPAPDLSSIKKPEPPPPLLQKETPFTGPFPIRRAIDTNTEIDKNRDFVHHLPGSPTVSDHDNVEFVVAREDFIVDPPAPGYTLARATFVSSSTNMFIPESQPIQVNNAETGSFTVFAQFLNSGNLSPIVLTFNLTWNPPNTDAAHDQYKLDLDDYNAQVAELQRAAYANAIRDRVKLVSGIRPRRSEDLRSEERHSVYATLIRKLQLFRDQHLGSELIQQIFDVDEMLYFVAPDYWRPSPKDQDPPPRSADSVGKYPVPEPPTKGEIDKDPLAGDAVVSWYSHTAKNKALDPLRKATDEYRMNYPITEDSQAAPLGSSLGWLIQIDGDDRRNEFLNAAWVKAVLPIRAGHELDALDWLAAADVEGEAGLGMDYPFQQGDPPDYQGKKFGDVLKLLAAALQAANTDIKNTLASEKVFETGFDPLMGGFRPAEPYMIFDQWVEVLPTDQVVAVEVTYDPKTGKQL
jgi:hypothetical protein